MKKGIWIGAASGENLAEKLDAVKAAGYDGVQFNLTNDDSEINIASSSDDIKSIKKQANERSLEIGAIGTLRCWQYSLTSSDKDEVEIARKDIIKQLETAVITECDTILVIPGVNYAPKSNLLSYSEMHKRAVDEFGKLSTIAEKYGVYIGVENVHNKFLVSPKEFKDFIDEIDSKYVQVFFDVGNSALYGHPEQWIRELGNRIKKVHFKDFKREKYEFVDILSGEVNYPEVMKALNEIGYDDWVIAEMTGYKFYPNGILHTTSVAMDIILGRKNI